MKYLTSILGDSCVLNRWFHFIGNAVDSIDDAGTKHLLTRLSEPLAEHTFRLRAMPEITRIRRKLITDQQKIEENTILFERKKNECQNYHQVDQQMIQ